MEPAPVSTGEGKPLSFILKMCVIKFKDHAINAGPFYFVTIIFLGELGCPFQKNYSQQHNHI